MLSFGAAFQQLQDPFWLLQAALASPSSQPQAQASLCFAQRVDASSSPDSAMPPSAPVRYMYRGGRKVSWASWECIGRRPSSARAVCHRRTKQYESIKNIMHGCRSFSCRVWHLLGRRVAHAFISTRGRCGLTSRLSMSKPIWKPADQSIQLQVWYDGGQASRVHIHTLRTTRQEVCRQQV